MVKYDTLTYYVDFSNNVKLTKEEKIELEMIQKKYRPIERVEYLIEYRIMDKITSDEFEKMTGVPFSCYEYM